MKRQPKSGTRSAKPRLGDRSRRRCGPSIEIRGDRQNDWLVQLFVGLDQRRHAVASDGTVLVSTSPAEPRYNRSGKRLR